jgi:hypothetical protein
VEVVPPLRTGGRDPVHHKQIEAVTVERDELIMLQREPERNGQAALLRRATHHTYQIDIDHTAPILQKYYRRRSHTVQPLRVAAGLGVAKAFPI